jgi:hypothetical protein
LRAALGALALAVALAGCATGGLANGAAAPGAGAAPLIATPPASVGVWYELGHFLAPWMAGDAPVPVAGPSAPTRVMGLRRDDASGNSHWLAIVIVQVAPGNAPCPAPTGLGVADAGLGDGGCLRMRGNADFDHWLEQQHAVLYQWLDGRGWTSLPRAWVGYRANAGGSAIEAHALIDPALLEPATRNNVDFLAGGQPARQWAWQFAAATRAASGGGTLNVPPLPFAPQLATPPEPTPAALPLPVIQAPRASSQ